MKNDVVPPSGLGSFRRVTASNKNHISEDSTIGGSDGFGAQRPERSASSPSGRSQSGSRSLMSKLRDALTEPANRGVLEAAVTVERIQRLRGR